MRWGEEDPFISCIPSKHISIHLLQNSDCPQEAHRRVVLIRSPPDCCARPPCGPERQDRLPFQLICAQPIPWPQRVSCSLGLPAWSLQDACGAVPASWGCICHACLSSSSGASGGNVRFRFHGAFSAQRKWHSWLFLSTGAAVQGDKSAADGPHAAPECICCCCSWCLGKTPSEVEAWRQPDVSSPPCLLSMCHHDAGGRAKSSGGHITKHPDFLPTGKTELPIGRKLVLQYSSQIPACLMCSQDNWISNWWYVNACHQEGHIFSAEVDRLVIWMNGDWKRKTWTKIVF